MTIHPLMRSAAVINVAVPVVFCVLAAACTQLPTQRPSDLTAGQAAQSRTARHAKPMTVTQLKDHVEAWSLAAQPVLDALDDQGIASYLRVNPAREPLRTPIAAHPRTFRADHRWSYECTVEFNFRDNLTLPLLGTLPDGFGREAIMAHEAAHCMQFKLGLPPSEAVADAFALSWMAHHHGAEAEQRMRQWFVGFRAETGRAVTTPAVKALYGHDVMRLRVSKYTSMSAAVRDLAADPFNH